MAGVPSGAGVEVADESCLIGIMVMRKCLEWLAGTLDRATNLSLANPGELSKSVFQDAVHISFSTRVGDRQEVKILSSRHACTGAEFP